jgi:fatty-acid desaturase
MLDDHLLSFLEQQQQPLPSSLLNKTLKKKNETKVEIYIYDKKEKKENWMYFFVIAFLCFILFVVLIVIFYYYFYVVFIFYLIFVLICVMYGCC